MILDMHGSPMNSSGRSELVTPRLRSKAMMAFAAEVDKKRGGKIPDEKRRAQLAKMARASEDSREWFALGEDISRMVDANLPLVDPIPIISQVQNGLSWDQRVYWETQYGLVAYFAREGAAPMETKTEKTKTEFPDFVVECFPTLSMIDLANGIGPTPDQVAMWAMEAILGRVLGKLYELLVAAVADGSANTNTSAGHSHVTQTNLDAAIDYVWGKNHARPQGIVGPQSAFTCISGFSYGYSTEVYNDIYKRLGMLESYRTVGFLELIQPLDETGAALKDPESGSEVLPISVPYNMFVPGANQALGGIKYATKGDMLKFNFEDGKEGRRGWHFIKKFSLGVINPSKSLFRMKVTS